MHSSHAVKFFSLLVILILGIGKYLGQVVIVTLLHVFLENGRVPGD